MKRLMLTTVDNPFDPRTQFDEWYAYDTQAGHNTAGLLARIVNTSDELSETDQIIAENEAIERIVRDNFSGIHRKV